MCEKNEELKHHGILGQKWGIRRYQNKDGTLTPEGRQYLYDEIDEYTNKYKKFDVLEIKKRNFKAARQAIKNEHNKNIRDEIKRGQKLIEQGEIECHKVLRNFYSNNLKNNVDAGKVKINDISESKYLVGYEYYKKTVNDMYDISFKSDIDGNTSVSFIPKTNKK